MTALARLREHVRRWLCGCVPIVTVTLRIDGRPLKQWIQPKGNADA